MQEVLWSASVTGKLFHDGGFPPVLLMIVLVLGTGLGDLLSDGDFEQELGNHGVGVRSRARDRLRKPRGHFFQSQIVDSATSKTSAIWAIV